MNVNDLVDQVVNHGVPESLMKGVINACDEFFNLREEEKEEFEGKYVLDPIRCGTSFNVKADKVFFWRGFSQGFCASRVPFSRQTHWFQV